MLFAGQLGTKLKIGQNIVGALEPCTGHDGVFKCDSGDPDIPCKGVPKSYISGFNASGMKNKIRGGIGNTESCSGFGGNDNSCSGTALHYRNGECEIVFE
jgi:hypothetical protein